MDIMELMAELTSERKLDIFCMCGSFFSPDWSLQSIVEFRYINFEQCIQWFRCDSAIWYRQNICQGQKQREKLDLELIWVTHRAVSIWRYQEQVLAQALGDFMLLSAFKRTRSVVTPQTWSLSSQGKSWGGSGGVCLRRPSEQWRLVFLSFQILTSQNL